jgi:hypothetical protein
LHILGHAELFEPIRNLLHRSAAYSELSGPKPYTEPLVSADIPAVRGSCGTANKQVDFITERHKVNRLGE